MTADDRYWWHTIAFVATLLFGGMFVGQCCGCAAITGDRLDNARIVAIYEIKLQHCKERGKVAGSYAVYEACAKAVDREMCAEYGVLCGPKDGGNGG